MHGYLDPNAWICSVNREDGFTVLVFHELLHCWVDDNINGTSPLLTKYHNEHCEVRSHIHLMAIQKMVYTNINRPDIVEMLDQSYRHLCLPTYRRAWEIVNDIEGCEAVINDILDTLKAQQ